ncbi:MAG TPA: DUF4010 domain-containing protein [Caulobacterales bacterium]|nr:DUF4010 domain-containing protein [Caulobacterales bacterium]
MTAEFLDLFQRLTVAFAVGFLVGVERGWTHRDAPEGSRAAGLRTHAIFGLAGGVCGAVGRFVGPAPLAALILAFAAAFIIFKLREADRDKDLSVTGTLAGLVVFALGVYAIHGDLVIASAIGVTLTVLLAFKRALHTWLGGLRAEEINSALFILAATAIALPLLPDRTIDPWNAVNPRELWLLTIVLAGASFAGYVAIRWLGPRAGVILGAMVSAIVSSTVTTADLGRRARAGEAKFLTVSAAAQLASLVMFARVGLLVAIFGGAALDRAGPPLAAAAMVTLAAAGAFFLVSERRADGDARPLALGNPLDLPSVARFALLLGAMLVIGRVLSAHYGPNSLFPFAATAGLADVDAVTLAVSGLVRTGLSPETGANAILLAAVVDTLSKSAIAIFTGGWRFGGLFSLCSIAALAAGLGVWFVL